MKKDRNIAVFTLVYILVFPLIYSLCFHDLRGYFFFMLLLMGISIPSFFAVLILLFFERFKEKRISEYIYLILSCSITTLSLTVLKYSDGDPKNIYPIFEESIFILALLCICSYVIAFLASRYIEKLKY